MRTGLGIVLLLTLGGCSPRESPVTAALAELRSGDTARMSNARKTLTQDRTSEGWAGLRAIGEGEGPLEPRIIAIGVMARRGDYGIMPWLVSRAGDGDPAIRRAAVVALGDLAQPDALQFVRGPAMSDPAPEVVAAAHEARDKLLLVAPAYYVEAARECRPLEKCLESVNALSGLKDPRAVEGLRQLYRLEARAEMQQAILWALGDIDDAEALAFVRQQLDSQQFLARSAAIYVVTHRKDAGAVEQLGRVLKDDFSIQNRIAAARALGAIGGAPAIAALEAALPEENEDLKVEIQTALKAVNRKS